MALKDCAKTLLSVGLSQAVLHTDQVKSCGSLGSFIACVPKKKEKTLEIHTIEFNARLFS